MHLHFIGIGGAGMAPLAELSFRQGHHVTGSDNELNSKCRHLIGLGIKITPQHCAENICQNCDMVVFSSAISPDNCERLAAEKLHIKTLRRGEFLAEFASSYRRCVAVSGTHGKSSITALLVSILRKCGKNPGFMIGAEVDSLPSCDIGDGDIFITEADESDGTHTKLKNFLGVVPNIEDDHSWSVGGTEALEKNFCIFADNSEYLICRKSPKIDRLFEKHPNLTKLNEIPENFAGLYGFQAENAFLAYNAAVLLGCNADDAVNAAADYPQVARRMRTISGTGKFILIEDYAHHPTEVRSAITFLRHKYKQHHLRIVFQPHRYARLEKYFNDFIETLNEADSCCVTPVFAAWSENGKVDSKMLAEKISNGCYCSGNWEEIAHKTVENLPGKSVIAVLGAGDIEKILPILKKLCGNA